MRKRSLLSAVISAPFIFWVAFNWSKSTDNSHQLQSNKGPALNQPALLLAAKGDQEISKEVDEATKEDRVDLSKLLHNIKKSAAKNAPNSSWERLKSIIWEMNDDDAKQTYEQISKLRNQYGKALEVWKKSQFNSSTQAADGLQEVLVYRDKLETLEYQLSQQLAKFLKQKYLK